ncbi:MAG: hypothetical protein AAGM21_05225 [Pseudomonadota bacterium]
MADLEFDLEEIDLGYAVIDAQIEGENGFTASMPFTICSHFRFAGQRILGPFVAGHQAGLSMLQSHREPKYARYYIDRKYSDLWSAEIQTRLISGILASARSTVDRFIPALPDRGRPAELWPNSNIARLLTGGDIADAANGFIDHRTVPYNRLRSAPFSVSPCLFRRNGISAPEFFGDFTYYELSLDEYAEYTIDDRLLLLLDLLRRSGPLYRSSTSGISEGVLFDPQKNLEFADEFFSRFL